MKTRFIYIEHISEIDPSSATIYDLNKRYIDSTGNMYGLKYNQISKKVEIVKLLRTTTKHADKVHKRMAERRLEQRKQDQLNTQDNQQQDQLQSDQNSQNNEPSGEEIQAEKTSQVSSSEIIKIDNFIEDTISLMQKHKQRIEGFIHNIGSSDVISPDDRDKTNKLDEYIRNLEIDTIQKMEKAQGYYKELTEYPRGISFYTGRLDTAAKNIVDEIQSDEKVMKYITKYEMHESIKEIYKKTEKIMNNLKSLFNEITDEEISSLNTSNRQHFNDSVITIDNTISEIKELLNKLSEFSTYLHQPQNFL